MRHALHFLAAHTLASFLTLLIFMVPLLAPYTPYAGQINWDVMFPYLKPFALGLGVSIWLITAIPALIIHKLIRVFSLYSKTDYTLIGLAAGIAFSIPVLKLMGTGVVNTDVTPVITHGWLLANQVLYAAAWAASGAVFGLCYYHLHSERYFH